MMTELIFVGIVVTLLTVIVAVLWYQVDELKKKLVAVDSPLPPPIMGNTIRLMEVGVGIRMVTEQLRQDAWKFAEWLFAQVGPYYGSDELGWIVRRNKDRIEVAFRGCGGGWYYMTVGDAEQPAWRLEAFCEALAGPPGRRLKEALEEVRTKRQTALGTIQTAMQDGTASAPV